MARFWVYIGDKIQGPVDIPSLRKVTGFNLLTQVCQEGEETWRMADEVIEIKSYFISPPRPNSFALNEGNAAPKLSSVPMPSPILEELTLPEPNTDWGNSAPALNKKPEPAGPASLRAVCDVCGYKNPRDVPVCMKCGEKLNGPSVSSSPSVTVGDPLKQPDGFPPTTAGMTKNVDTPAPLSMAAPAAESPSNAMVEISLSKLVLGASVLALVMGGSFWGYRSWKKKQVPKALPAVSVAVPQTTTRRVRTAVPRHIQKTTAAPKLSQKAERAEDPTPLEPKEEAASYRVVAEASPLKKRFSSPVNSPYAVKRRANKGLWTSQEDQAIQQVQRNRIYGGQRTIERNVEILMQILRDREYNTAFESGKRIYLYNDLDWSATLKDGPLYEVRLSFSGGKEVDGSPKKPLHFAFAADLERGTVEPGGQDQLRSNTLHAFFDESRIAPEERRAIAKDTEELVLAAQPGASPLAMDTVVRQFAKVYTTAALSRVADAYDLTAVKKKLAHDTRLGSDDPTAPAATASPAAPVKETAQKSDLPSEAWVKAGMKAPPASSSAASQDTGSPKSDSGKSISQPFKGGPATEFRMERGAGREKTFLLRGTSRASVSKIWETVTGYDRLKQFLPDMLASEREGQDGAAVIVHTVCLTRFMIFVFKINLHLRVIEHPAQHTLEFERIAGDFESVRGSLEITTDPATHESLIFFRTTIVPDGTSMSMKLETMARRLLIPQMDTLRAKAESL